jgi:hypothetical protein
LLSARNTDQHLLQFERIGSNLAFISLPDSSWIAARFCNSSISVIFCAIFLKNALTIGSSVCSLLGQYMASSFALSSDGHGGTFVTDPAVAAQATIATPHHA